MIAMGVFLPVGPLNSWFILKTYNGHG